MASIGTDPKGRRRVLFVAGDGSRKQIYLGLVKAKQAEEVRLRVEALLRAQDTGAIDEVTATWVLERNDRMHKKLSDVGLVKPRNAGNGAIGAFIDRYLESRPNLKPRTVINFKQLRKKLVKFFGETRDMRTVSAGDTEAFRLQLVNDELGENTIRRFIGRSRQLFKAAIRQELVRGNNPFDGMAAAVGTDKSRQFFVTREMICKVIEKCPNAQWKLLIALSRYGGVRTPSESLALKWSDINWGEGRIKITSPKTEHHQGKDCRIIPLFPELRPFLEDALGEQQLLAGDGEKSDYVITQYRDAGQNLRTQFERIITKAGLKKWPKLFHNMRASRQTELAESYPIHVVCEWIGNSKAIAQKHYLQVTDAHFERAIQSEGACAPPSAHNPAEPGATERKTDDQTCLVGAGNDDERNGTKEEYPQQGSNLRPPV